MSKNLPKMPGSAMLVADPETLPGAEPLYRLKDSLTIRQFKATGVARKTLRAPVAGE
jgi:hypothetical protein